MICPFGVSLFARGCGYRGMVYCSGNIRRRRIHMDDSYRTRPHIYCVFCCDRIRGVADVVCEARMFHYSYMVHFDDHMCCNTWVVVPDTSKGR